MESDFSRSPRVRWHLEHRREEASFRSQAREAVARLPGTSGSVLDLGCGTAALAPDLLDRGLRYTGLDRSGDMLAGARVRLGGRNSVLLQADAGRLPFGPARFDAVTSLGLFEYLPDPVGVLREIRRVLRDGGCAILTVPRRESPYRRCLALVAPFLRILGREDPFDLRSGRRVDPALMEAWARDSGMRVGEALPVSPAVLPWPMDRLLPGIALHMAKGAGRGWGTVWMFVLFARGTDEPSRNP